MRHLDKVGQVSHLRRQLLKGTSAAATLCTLGAFLPARNARADEAKTLRLALSWIPNFQFADLWIALEHGYYDDQDLTVDWRSGGPNTPNPVERVASGEVDIGIQETLRVLIEAISRGNDFVIFGAKYQQRPGGILSLAKSPIKTVEDLVGKRIICPSAVDARTVEISLRIAGLAADFTYVPGGTDPNGLLYGQGDGMVAYATNQPLMLEALGMIAEKDYFHRPWGTLGQPGYNSLFFARRDFLRKNRETVVQLMRGLVRGQKMAAANIDAAAKLTVNKYGLNYALNIDQQKRALEVAQDFMQSDDTRSHGLLWVDTARLTGPIYDVLRAGGIEDLPEADTIVDMSILTDAYRL